MPPAEIAVQKLVFAAAREQHAPATFDVNHPIATIARRLFVALTTDERFQLNALHRVAFYRMGWSIVVRHCDGRAARAPARPRAAAASAATHSTARHRVQRDAAARSCRRAARSCRNGAATERHAVAVKRHAVAANI